MRLLQVNVYDPVVVVLADPQHRRSLSSSSIRSLKRRDNVQNEQNPQNPSPFFPSFFSLFFIFFLRGIFLFFPSLSSFVCCPSTTPVKNLHGPPFIFNIIFRLVLGVVWVSSGSLAFITYRIEFENQSILMDLFLFSYFFQRVKREKQMTSQSIPP
jgi:hypothetical protein